MKEATLMTDSYNKNIMYEGNKAMVHQIYHLIVMDKGTDDLNPNKGVGIADYYYEYKDDSVLHTLENEISEQIRTYTPYLPTNIICKAIKNNGGKYILHVFVSLNDIMEIINVSTNGETSQLALLNL